jgi:hypothetical protein
MKKLTKQGGFQGDVSIVPADKFPTDAKPTNNRIVAYGESTGHNHQIIGKVDMRETAEAFYFQVAPDEKATMVHIGEEHEAIEILPGQVWRVAKTPQVEYDGSEERRVLD